MAVPSGMPNRAATSGKRQADVVMEHEDRALLERQASERSVELVTVMDGQDAVLGDRLLWAAGGGCWPTSACDAVPRRSTRSSGFDAATARSGRRREGFEDRARHARAWPGRRPRPGRRRGGSTRRSPCSGRPPDARGRRTLPRHHASPGPRVLAPTDASSRLATTGQQNDALAGVKGSILPAGRPPDWSAGSRRIPMEDRDEWVAAAGRLALENGPELRMPGTAQGRAIHMMSDVC